MFKQQLHIELKDAPGNASQVPCSANLSLNSSEGRSSVADKVLVCNSLDVNLPQNTEGLKDRYVFVKNIDNEPLMPCSKSKARKLIKSKKAKVISLNPFTIQLNFECENQVQEIILGIDSGYKNIGFSVITDKKELVCGTVILDSKTSKRLNDKRMYRRNRRNKLWYREPRWQNRANSRKKGKLMPSVQKILDTHINFVEKIKKLLPISKVIIETASFDIQKIKNPDIHNEQYQQGDLLGYQNIKSYILAREQCKCQLCSKSVLGEKVNLHHIIRRRDGGTDKSDNLVLLHEKCHIKVHKDNLTFRKNRQYKAESLMSIIRWKLRILGNETFGYLTNFKRNELGLEKTHFNDAFVIANGTNQVRVKPIDIQQKHRNNRSLGMQRKGFAPSSRTKRHKIQPLDMCWYQNKLYYTKGSQNKGLYVLLDKAVAIKKLNKIYHTNSLVWKQAS